MHSIPPFLQGARGVTFTGRVLFRALLHKEFQVTALTVNNTILIKGNLFFLPNTYHLTVMAVTCKRLCRERCFAHPMRPDDLRSRDLRLSSQPTEDRPHRDPRPATRSPESHDPRRQETREQMPDAGDHAARVQEGAKRQESRRLEYPKAKAGPRFRTGERKKEAAHYHSKNGHI